MQRRIIIQDKATKTYIKTAFLVFVCSFELDK